MSPETVNRLNELSEGERSGMETAVKLASAEWKSYTRQDLRMQELHLENVRRSNLRAAELEAPPSAPYRGLRYARLRHGHDHLYYGRWRGLSASIMDLQRAHHQLGEHLETLEREVTEAGSAEAKTYLEKALNAHLRADPRSYPDSAMLSLDNALAYAHHSLNYLLRREGAQNHDPEAFQSFHDVASVPFREEI